MKRFIALVVLVLVSGLILVPAATATNHKFPLCHGKNSVPCRPDPQPSHGKDCLKHGKGGVNEDHCTGVAPSPTPTPTETPKCSVACSTPTPTPQTPHQKHVAHLANTPLAVTGVGDYAPVLILGGIVLIALGAALVSYRRG